MAPSAVETVTVTETPVPTSVKTVSGAQATTNAVYRLFGRFDKEAEEGKKGYPAAKVR